MTILGQLSSGMSDPERLVGLLGIGALAVLAAWRAVLSFRQTQPAPDPWDAQVEAELSAADAVPLCPHCLCAQTEDADFCPECGTPVGQYTNWLPFPQLFSIGHVLRIGTFGTFKRSPVTILGFWLLGLIEYTLMAPIYWVMLLRNKMRSEPAAPENPTMS